MPFVSVERAIYGKNPLIDVVCQLRFPRILSINETAPAAFQDYIRQEYPVFNVAVEQQQQFAFNADGTFVPSLIQSESNKNYCFSSADNAWTVNLTSTFLSMSTSKYSRWEEFYHKMSKPIAALSEIYKPAFYERVGLRYVDVITKSELGLTEASWGELIEPFALGFLSNDEIKDDIKNYSSVVEMDIGDSAFARIGTTIGFVEPLGPLTLQTQTMQNEQTLIIDSDLYYFRKELNELEQSLEYLHNISTKIIRAIIKDKLHVAMEPKTI